MRRHVARYTLVLAAYLAAVVALLEVGMAMYPTSGATLATAPPAETWLQHLTRPLGLLLMQVVVIVAAARLAGHAVQRLGQPMVVGAILAGILLGPSLLGLLWPQATAFLFPEPSLGGLRLLAQLGVILFMFSVGLELQLEEFRQRIAASIAISSSSMAIPFALGLLFAMATYGALAPPGTSFLAFALFIGVAMSITAFPVLARILQERKLLTTPVGQMAIASAAVGDAMAWCLLAAIVAIVTAGSPADALGTLAVVAAFVAVMFGVVRPALERWVGAPFRPDRANEGPVAAALLVAFIGAGFTHVAGIHALFGAFVAGAVMPQHGAFRAHVRDRIHALATVILLPVFFAYTGLRTEIGLLATPADWLMCAGIIAVAVTGKGVGTLLAAHATGMPWRESFALGALMNSRGLMELLVLNVGYELGILSPRVFTMFVIMALVTTWMAGPLVSRALAPARTA